MPDFSTVQKLVTYMAWANDVMLEKAEQLADMEVNELRDTLFDNISGTFDYILVIEEIFLAHLEGRDHSH
jgi:uncharacterized damage-inducible protein DinB